MKATLTEVLAAAEPGAVASFNVLDLDMAIALAEAAAAASRPLVLGVATRHFAAVRAPLLARALVALAEQSPVKIALHLDHATPKQTELIQMALDAGFTSIMIDGSALPLAENIRVSAAVAVLAGSYGASVEGELGGIAGEEGVADTHGAALRALPYTDASEAQRYVDETGVDALAIAVGTAHGIYAAAPQIGFETILACRERARVPLVLHGATGVRPEDIRRCVKCGIRKINFFSGFLAAAMDRARGDAPSLGYDLLALKQRFAADWAALARDQIELFAAR